MAAPVARMAHKHWQLASLALATVLLAWLVLPAHPAAAIVAIAGMAVAALLHIRATRIQSELETLVHRLFAASERERVAVEAERRVYLDRLRSVQRVVTEQHRALTDLVEELDRLPEELRLEETAEAPPEADLVAHPARIRATA